MLTITGKRLSTRINHDLAVVVNGKQIENVRCAKLLEQEIDHELTFIPHVEKLSKKLSQRIGILKRIKHCLPLKHRLIFYNTMITPVIDYVNVVWRSCDKHCLNRVLKLQKRAARVILDADCQAYQLSMYQLILKVYLSLLTTLIHGRLGMPTSILLALLSNVKLKEEEHLL